MAIYYLAAQVIGRSAGRSSVAAAAYRSGERIVDERTGQVHDYTRRREDIEKEILAPADAPAWVHDRSQLWNHVEAVEKRTGSQLAREIVVALPVELDRESQRELIRGYVQEQFVARGMVADLAIHHKEGNPHVHIMLTMREIGPEGFGKKVRDWNRSELLEEWREQWARHANRAMERAGCPERVDHRSLEAQGKELVPQVHLGPDAAALERRGVPTEKGDHNRLVAEHDAAVIDLEKARAEREALRQEKGRADRFAARVAGGWHEESAKAMEFLERQRSMVLTQDDLTRLKDATYKTLSRVNEEIGRIEAERRRLTLINDLLKRWERHAAEVEKLETPWGVLRRLFSHHARFEYDTAKRHLASAEDMLTRAGVRNAADLERHRSRWQTEDAPRKPALERQATDLTKTFNLAVSAADGFVREWMRQIEQNREKERARQAALLGRGRSGAPERNEEQYRRQHRTRDDGRGR